MDQYTRYIIAEQTGYFSVPESANKGFVSLPRQHPQPDSYVSFTFQFTSVKYQANWITQYKCNCNPPSLLIHHHDCQKGSSLMDDSVFLTAWQHGQFSICLPSFKINYAASRFNWMSLIYALSEWACTVQHFHLRNQVYYIFKDNTPTSIAECLLCSPWLYCFWYSMPLFIFPAICH